jgi:NifU-like protein involved in Fe-S cluster formation
MAENTQLITEYAKNPSNKYEMTISSSSHNEESRVCGDTVQVFLLIDDNKITDYSFV